MRSRVKTGIALLLTAIMLFPVYWMINVSLTKDTDMRHDPPHLFPVHGTLEGYSAVLHQQIPYLGTSFLVGLGTVALTLVISAPAGYSLAKLRPRGGGLLSFVLLMAQMIPGIIMAMGFYAIYLRLGVLNSAAGLVLADSTIAVPFGVLIFTAFMSGLPSELLLLAVHRNHRRRGVATALMDWLDGTLRMAGIVSVQVEVRATNAVAQAFYAKLGYRRAKAMPHYYQGIEDAWMLVKELRPADA